MTNRSARPLQGYRSDAGARGSDLCASARRLGRRRDQDRGAGRRRRSGRRTHGPDFQNLHRNKRSLTLNLKAPEGLEILQPACRKSPTSWWRITVLT